MNIELIKTEIAKLSQIVASWSDESNISAIEKELLLTKLQNLYEIIRFDTAPQAQPIDIAAVATAVVTESIGQVQESDEQAENESEPEVEVEFLFDDDEELNMPFVDEREDIAVAAAENEPDEISATETHDEVSLDEQPSDNVDMTESEAEEQKSEQENEQEDVTANKQAATTSEEQDKATTQEQAEKQAEIAAEESVEESIEPSPQAMGNLFGMEEPKRHTRSKHLRMMSLYDDAEPAKPKEKSVNISKIFDLSIDDVEPVSKEDIAEETTLSTTTIADASEHNVTLADTIAPNQQTLADTISRPAPLADEITNTKIASLHDGVGINDKFLMIRDLFDGDEAAYKKALQGLDAQETFDDCMIYIVENFAWNPDSEGAKFIMKLLERKHS